MYEHLFQCPYCWETISMLLDTSLSTTSYIEDCEICCRPIQITPSFDGNELIAFSADDIEK